MIAGIAKRLFGGESMFVNLFTAEQPGELVLTQAFPGDIECIELKGNKLYLQPGAFIACDPGVKLGLGWAGLKMLIGGEGLFRLSVSGQGRVWFGAYGGIFTKDIEGEYIVDTGHLVDQCTDVVKRQQGGAGCESGHEWLYCTERKSLQGCRIVRFA